MKYIYSLDLICLGTIIKKKHHLLREFLAEQKLYSIKLSWTDCNIRWIKSADISETVSIFLIRILISIPPVMAFS
jgi:hypothetical protein